jgi:hypothetical protein
LGDFFSSSESIWMVFGVIFDDGWLVADLVGSNSELGLGQSTCLANADVVEHCTGLDSLQVLDENFVILELVNGKGHGNRDSQWKTFWNGDDQDNDCNDNNFTKFQKSVICEEIVITAEHDEANQENRVCNDTNNACSDCIVTNGLSSLLQFLFKEGVLLIDNEVTLLSVSC